MNYRNITAVIPTSQLTELASSDGVFAIEEASERVRFDEAQGQIVAGNLSGNVPSGPGYLSWLASKGFNSTQFGSFAVNVADDAYSLTGHPDLPNTAHRFSEQPYKSIRRAGRARIPECPHRRRVQQRHGLGA